MTYPLTLSSESVIDLPLAEVFALFGAPEASSWLFGARCDRIAVGAPVRISLPVQSHADFAVEVLGRFTRIRHQNLIVIEHHQPWRGEMRVSFQATEPYRTRVRVQANLDANGIDWLGRRIGLVLPTPPPTEAVRIGVLTSKSGPAAIYAMGVEHLAELAVDEVNAMGGIGGRPLEVLIADDATEPAQAAAETARMIRAGCRAIFACTTSASFSAVTKTVGDRGIVVVQPVINEGGAEAGTVVRFGERPAAQVAALARPLMDDAGGRRWFLVGQRYSWSYGAHRAARRILADKAGHVVGQHYVPLGTADFGAVIERIRKSGADIVMSSLIGSDEVAFQRQCTDAGLRSTTRMLSLVMDESTYEHIGPGVTDGIWTALGYFESAAAAGNRDLVARYRQQYGRWAPPVTALSETVYEAVLQYARILETHPDDHARAHADLLRTRSAATDSVTVGARDLTSQGLYLARTRSDGSLHIFDRTD
ncbi:branched-chain amino acid transport system substrate-binding protein [Rhodococcus rhodochrous J38]|uniref:substrate-binding protein n=1 Tax=Rhodococcus rhodochrous TaxID=1829 RepID=UPI0011AD6210|nr:substrate-binding protein [Rhodococcus rhodochrous]TWH41891.1 branched-chain amino acid transport system substrate-binding protein [Rhodococcus rhodochrous J38]